MNPSRTLLTLFILTMSSITAQADFQKHIGIQMWSLRANTMANGLPSSFDLVKGWGFRKVEGGLATPNMTPQQVRAEIDARGLVMPGAHVQYDSLVNDLDPMVAAAKILGVQHVMCPWIPHEGPFSRATVDQAIVDFNRAGAAFRAAGIKFGYHPHGYEFVPTEVAGETLLDELIRGCDPKDVSFQMDVFWVVHGGGDPVALLNKYAGRWASLHVKDIRKGAPTGAPTGRAPATDNVAVGSGAIDWTAVIGTARKVGVQYYFLEDETPAPLENIPLSLAYLQSLDP